MEPTTKPWYQKPQNFTKGLFLAGLAYLGVHLVPLIIVAAETTLYAGFLLGVLAIVLFGIMDAKVRNAVSNIFNTVTYHLTNFVYTIDPVATIENYLKTMNSRLNDMLDSRDALGGQVQKMSRKIKDNEDKIEQSLKLAQQADKQGDDLGKTSFAMQAEALATSNEKLKTVLDQMTKMLKVLDKIYANTNFIVKNTRMQVDIKKQEREAVMSTYKATTKAWSILNGDTEQQRMYNVAMESIEGTLGRQVSEIDRIMNASSGMMNGVDLERGIIKDDALKLFEKWSKEGSSALLPKEKAVLLSEGTLDVTPIKKVANKKERFSSILD